MVKKVVRDPMFLAQKSEPATEADKPVVQDLLDTLRANLDYLRMAFGSRMKYLFCGGAYLDEDIRAKY